MTDSDTSEICPCRHTTQSHCSTHVPIERSKAADSGYGHTIFIVQKSAFFNEMYK